MKLGTAIRTVRKQLGISQTELADRTGISQTSLSKIEKDVRPTDANVKKICKALGVPELVLYVLASESSDIPADKQPQFQMLQSVVKNLALEIVGHDNKKFLNQN